MGNTNRTPAGTQKGGEWAEGAKAEADGEVAAGLDGWGSNGLEVTCTQRSDGAVEYRNARGQRHRDDGPAIEYPDGTRRWYQRGHRHREDGPAVEKADGTREWWRNGELHRDHGPAIEYDDGARMWFQHDELHRVDGPAIEDADGRREWWRNGHLVDAF